MRFVGPMNSARDPLVVPFQTNVWTFKVLVGSGNSAWDPLTDLCPTWNQLLMKKKKNVKMQNIDVKTLNPNGHMVRNDNKHDFPTCR